VNVRFLVVVLFVVGCAKAPEPASKLAATVAADGGIDEDGANKTRRKKRDPDQERRIRALSADVAALERRLDGGAFGDYAIVNAHEHLRDVGDLEKYLPAARKAGIRRTVVVASPEFTIKGQGSKGEPSMSENFAVLLAAAKEHPDEIVPFFTIDPKDPDKLARAQRHVAAGGKGIKLYSGHTNFYDQPLDEASMEPLLAYLEQERLPINWHINLEKWLDDFERVLTKHPGLNIMVPHYGVLFWKTDPQKIERLKRLLRAHPTLFIDTSLGTREILIDGLQAMSETREAWRKLVAEFPDRVLFGTDAVITGNREKTTRWYFAVMQATRDQLEKESFSTPLAAAYSKYADADMDPDGTFEGLALEPALLKKIYEENPARWLNGPSTK
jgi:uncharacterized protein